MTCPHNLVPSRYPWYFECIRCHALFHEEPSPQSIYEGNYWSGEHSSLTDQCHNTSVHQENGITKDQFALASLRKEKFTRVMDIGCAPGTLLRAFKEQQRAEYLVGVEVNPSYQKEIQEIISHPADLLFGFFPQVTRGLPSESVDCITALDTLEHSFEPEGFIKECARLLNKSGELFLMLPMVTEFGELPCVRMAAPEHVTLFSPQYLRMVLLDAGFVEPVFSQWCEGHDAVWTSKS